MTREAALELLSLDADADEESISGALAVLDGDLRSRLRHARSPAVSESLAKKLAELEAAAKALGHTYPSESPSSGRPRIAPRPRVPTPTAKPVLSPAVVRPILILVAGGLLGFAILWQIRRPEIVRDGATGLTFVYPRGSSLGIGRTPVTTGQFDRFVRATGYRTDAERSGHCQVYSGGAATPQGVDWRTAFGGERDLPVVCVSLRDARAYAEWATRASGSTIRLPAGEEWSWAAAAGSTESYAFGSDPSVLPRHGNVAGAESRLPWSSNVAYRDPYPTIAPVAQFRANRFGVFDVHGNVWEWTEERFSGGQWSLRGGGWASHPTNAALEVKNGLSISAASNDVGFRVVRSSQ